MDDLFDENEIVLKNFFDDVRRGYTYMHVAVERWDRDEVESGVISAFTYDLIPRKGPYFYYNNLYSDRLAGEIDGHRCLYEEHQATFINTISMPSGAAGVSTLPVISLCHFRSPMYEVNASNGSASVGGDAVVTQANAFVNRQLFDDNR